MSCSLVIAVQKIDEESCLCDANVGTFVHSCARVSLAARLLVDRPGRNRSTKCGTIISNGC